jgi:hypothetical protein
MMNLGLKLAIPSAFVAVLIFLGEGVEQRRESVSEPDSPPSPTAFSDAATPSGPPAIPPKADERAPSAVSPPSAATSFAAEVLRLSAEADDVDRLWQAYKEECGVRVSRQYDFGREWFSIWDRAAEPNINAPGCSDLLGRLRQAGEKIRRDVQRARASSHQARGTEIGMLRWHALQWPQLEEASSERPRRSAAAVSASTRAAENRASERPGGRRSALGGP